MAKTRTAVAAILMAAALSWLPQAYSAQAPSTRAVVLGVGSPVLSAERAGTSIGIVAGETLYVFDAGAGVERRLLEAAPQLASLGVTRFGPVFITHLHLDHTLGLAALYRYHQFGPNATLTMGTAPLIVYGPEGIASMMQHLATAFMPLDPKTRDALTVKTTELSAPGLVHEDANVTVQAIEVVHKGGPAFGYRIQTADRVIVISGDTRPVDSIVEACNGCDILFHEVFGLDFGLDGPPEDGPAAGHTSAAELGELARRARPKLLVLYHTLRGSEEELVGRIRQSFDGPIAYARDLDVF